MFEDDGSIAVSYVQIASVCGSADLGTRVGTHRKLLPVGGCGSRHSGCRLGAGADAATAVLNWTLLRYLSSASNQV